MPQAQLEGDTATLDAGPLEESLVGEVEELGVEELIEDISIDGMCGVY